MILAAGLTPAWQQILCFDRLEVGEVNRAREAHWCASGKVLNVGLALHHLGCAAITLAPLGGLPGEAIRREFASTHIAARWIDCQRPTRACTTIIERPAAPPTVTELVENAAPLTVEELDAFRTAFDELAADAEWVILSGSLPQGTPPAIWADLLARRQKPTILDVRGPELLRALPCRPHLVKLNRDELAHTVGRALENEDSLRTAMGEVLQAGARAIAVTSGAADVWLAAAAEAWRFTPPHSEVVNPIGSGDSMTAAVAWALSGGASLVEAMQLGVAAGSQNATMLLPARLELHGLRELAARVVVTNAR